MLQLNEQLIYALYRYDYTDMFLYMVSISINAKSVCQQNAFLQPSRALIVLND